MPKSISSPDRHSVKVTYLEREKPKIVDHSASDDIALAETASNSTKKKSKKQLGAMEPPDSPPTRIDFSRPPPSSASQAGSVRSKASKAAHIRSKSSGATLGRPSKDDSMSVASTKKPVSSASKPPRTPGRNQVAVSDTDMDDATSVAESFSGAGRVRRTEAERISYFKNQPECDTNNITPHLVRCLRCQKDVNLGKKTTYAVRPWEKHRQVCDQKVPASMFENNPEGSSKEHHESSRKTAEERKAILDADPDAVEVKPHEVLCKRCHKWIRLHKANEYALSNWNVHKQSCSGPAPSDRVATAERILRITNDNDAKSFDAHHVMCKHCGVKVLLEGPGDYNLTKWELHKTECERHPKKASLATGSAAKGTSASPLPQTGTKRPREEDEDESEEVREANRPRTEKYVAVERPSGPFGWFMIPFKAFLSGFQDSLKSESAS